MRVKTRRRLERGEIRVTKTRKGTACLCEPLKNGRCKFHGGLSTGPNTPEGRAKIAEIQRERHRKTREKKKAKLQREVPVWNKGVDANKT